MIVEDRFADKSIEKYELEQLVGKDASAETYLAYDPEFRRHVLISLLGSTYTENAIDRARYLKRVNSLAQIRHPNIANIYDSGETADSRPYIVSEHIEGFPLADRLNRLAQQQSPTHALYALTLIRQIASGLSLAERLEYFHYELTPKHILLRNVTLKTDDSAVLVNLDILPIQNHPSTAPGDTYRDRYLSPEQKRGKEIDSRSQVYSLGAILYQLLTGKPPDPIKSKWQRSLQANGSSATPLNQLRADLSPETCDLVEKSLRTRSSARYDSMSEFVGALDGALAAEDLHIHKTDLAEPQRPRPIYWAPLLMLVLCMSLAAALWWFTPGKSTNEPQTAASGGNPSELAIAINQGSSSSTPTRIISSASAVSTSAATRVTATIPNDTVVTSLPAAETVPKTSVPATTVLTYEPLPTASPAQQPATIVPPAATTIPSTPQPEYSISVSSASLRRGPGTRYGVSSYLLRDETVVILAQSGGADKWYVVETADGRVGWISASVGEPLRSSDLESIENAVTVPAPPPTFTPTATFTPIPTETPVTPSVDNNGNNNQGDRPKSTPTPPL